MQKILSVLVLSLAALIFANCSSSPNVSAEDLKAPFIDNRAEIDGCYEKVSRKQPDLQSGTVELKFLIDSEGKTYKTIFLKKRSTLQSKLLNACLKKVVSGWQFPKGKNLEVVYPFQFEPKVEGVSGESKTTAPNENMDIINTTPPDENETSGDETPETPAE